MTTTCYDDGGLAALLYDFIETGLIEAGRSVCCGDVAFYLDLARRRSGPVLEVGAGTGRISWALAAAGHEVTAVDLSATMLRLAEEKRGRHDGAVGARVKFIRQDMTALDLDGQYPLIIVPYRSFNYLVDPAAGRAALSALRRRLAPDGLLVLHLLGAPHENVGAAGPTALRGRLTPAGVEAEWRGVDFRSDAARQLSVSTIRYTVFAADGTTLRESLETLTYRWATRQEMRYLFELTGWAEEGFLERFPGAPETVGKEQIWLLRAGDNPRHGAGRD